MRKMAEGLRRTTTRGRGSLLAVGAVCVVVFVVAAVAVLVLPGPAEESGSDLPGSASSHGIESGVAVAVDPLRDDSDYRDVVTDHHTSVTAENTLKWVHVQPERHEFDWSGSDTVLGH